MSNYELLKEKIVSCLGINADEIVYGHYDINDFDINVKRIYPDPMLNDAIKYSIMIEPRTYTHISLDGSFCLNGHKIDLSKPYLKDQSQELIDYLLTL